ncbi:MAG: D-amino-acid transaminase [Granulosicoccus sp.]|nr:D-amino-acid transaminase [Granulosicoccus sp.]
MSRTFYVNGDFVAEEDAKISVLDRGFLFADAVYEVSSVLQGRLIDNKAHLKRLARSLAELSMAPPCAEQVLVDAQMKLIQLNGLNEGLLYLQVSRGVADRDFAYPARAKSSIVMFTQVKNILTSPMAEQGIHVISIPDLRWKRRDIKTVGLLAPSMGKQAALDAGVHDAWMVEDALVTEGTSSNAYIVTEDRKIHTRNLGHEILSGITRHAVLKFAAEAGYTVVEQPFSIEAARQATEAFSTSASTFVMPVVNIDGITLGDGTPGPVSRQLRKLYIEAALERQDL